MYIEKFFPFTLYKLKKVNIIKKNFFFFYKNSNI